MTLTSAEVAKMQKHNADLVRENETLTRDNAELRRQVAWHKEGLKDDCEYCKNVKSDKCFACFYRQHGESDWEFAESMPPEAPDA